MVHYLAEGLIKDGFPVFLFAPKDAKTKAKLIPIADKPMSLIKTGKETEASRKLRIELSVLSNMKHELIKKKASIGLILNQTP